MDNDPASQPPKSDSHNHHSLAHRLANNGENLIREGFSELDRIEQPAWRRVTAGETRWLVASLVIVAIVVQLVLRADLAFRPQWLLPSVEGALLVIVLVANPVRINRESRWLRGLGLALVVVASIATATSAGRLANALLHGHGSNDAPSLLTNGAAIWLTNVIVFALWYWELDRGGPAARAHNRQPHPDFLFPQMQSPELAKPGWEPTLMDYLYVSFTNATAFSPTDAMPLSRWAKLAMTLEASISLITVALVIARAINVLD